MKEMRGEKDKMEGLQNLRYLLQEEIICASSIKRMHIIKLLYRKARRSTFGFAGQKT